MSHEMVSLSKFGPDRGKKPLNQEQGESLSFEFGDARFGWTFAK
jgi:hypothetical protein